MIMIDKIKIPDDVMEAAGINPKKLSQKRSMKER